MYSIKVYDPNEEEWRWLTNGSTTSLFDSSHKTRVVLTFGHMYDAIQKMYKIIRDNEESFSIAIVDRDDKDRVINCFLSSCDSSDILKGIW